MGFNLSACTRLFLVFILSSASFTYLNNQSELLRVAQQISIVSNTSVTNFRVVGPNNSKETEGLRKTYNKKLLPDIRLMELFITKLKEGIPTLKPREF